MMRRRASVFTTLAVPANHHAACMPWVWPCCGTTGCTDAWHPGIATGAPHVSKNYIFFHNQSEVMKQNRKTISKIMPTNYKTNTCKSACTKCAHFSFATTTTPTAATATATATTCATLHLPVIVISQVPMCWNVMFKLTLLLDLYIYIFFSFGLWSIWFPFVGEAAFSPASMRGLP